jgi:hypothetical protein
MAGDSIDFYVNMLSGNMQGLAAVGALKSLDDAAAKATSRIQGLEGQVEAAKAKLDSTKAATSNIEALSAQLAAAKTHLDAIKSGKVPFDPKEYKRASDEVTKLAEKTEAAKAKQAAAVEAQKSKIDVLTKKVAEEKAAHASNANLVTAKRAQMVKGLDEQVSGLGRVLGKAQEAGGPVGALAGKLAALGKGGAVGMVVALAVALAAVAAAGVLAAVALTKYALVASDATRSSQLLSAAAAGSGSAGWELDKVVEQLSNKIPQTAQRTAEWARGLALANIAGRDMQRTLTTMGVVASAVGDQAAGKIKGIAEASHMAQKLMLGARDRFGEFAALSGTGIKAADIYAAVAKSMRTSIPEAKRMVDAGIVPFKRGLEALEQAAETRFGPIVARQMMSLDTQIAKLKENIGRLFGGANIENFLAALKQVTDLFDTNTVTGFVLREVFTSVFTSIANVAAKAMPYVKTMIMGAAFAVIMFATYAKRLAKGFQETFGGSLGGIDKMKAAFIIGGGLIGGLIGGIVGLAAAFVLLGAVAMIATAPIWIPFALAAVVIYATVKAITAVIDEAKSLGKELEQIDLGAAAENIMNSLIDGIKAKIQDVKDVISDVGAAITGAFDAKMEIKSPSKVMTRRANWVVDPLVSVPEDRAGEVRQAIGGLGVGDGTGSPRGVPGGGGQRAEPSITFNNCTFGGGNEESVRRVIREERALFFLGEARGDAMVPA